MLLPTMPALGQEPPPPEINTQADFGRNIEPSDGFSTEVATGDFNGDDYQDFSVGAPFDDIGEGLCV
jgi:hypothetical protein